MPTHTLEHLIWLYNKTHFYEYAIALKKLGYLGKLITLAGLFLVLQGTANAYNEIALQTIAMESANQPFQGQILVAETLLTRAKTRNKTLTQVCLEKKQFSCWNDPASAKAWLRKYYTPEVRQKALKALSLATGNKNITHYHTKSVHPKWSKGKKPTYIVGAHKFYVGLK